MDYIKKQARIVSQKQGFMKVFKWKSFCKQVQLETIPNTNSRQGAQIFITGCQVVLKEVKFLMNFPSHENPYVKNWELSTHSLNFGKMVSLNTWSHLRSTLSNPISYKRCNITLIDFSSNITPYPQPYCQNLSSGKLPVLAIVTHFSWTWKVEKTISLNSLARFDGKYLIHVFF